MTVRAWSNGAAIAISDTGAGVPSTCDSLSFDVAVVDGQRPANSHVINDQLPQVLARHANLAAHEGSFDRPPLCSPGFPLAKLVTLRRVDGWAQVRLVVLGEDHARTPIAVRLDDRAG